VLRTYLLPMTVAPAAWDDVAARLRPFIARRIAPTDVDDVMQDVFIRMQRGLPALRDDERFASWLFQVARSSIADHLRTRARHPLATTEATPEPHAETPEDDREVARSLAGCVTMFVAQLASPYREAVTLVELEGLTTREAADLMSLSISGMKSRVQRGRAQLRELFEACCEIALDVRGKVTAFSPRALPCPSCRRS
jgi:RNA polymerase sigma-70 factor (ECF subfamily)